MSGQAIAGTIASAAQLLTVYFGNGKSSLAVLSGNVGGSGSGGDDAVWWLRVRTSIYFGLSALFMVVSTTVWSQLKKTLGSEQGISQTQGSAEVYQAVASNEDEGAIGDGEEVETGSRAVPGLLAPMRDTSPRLDRLDGAVYDNGNAHGQGTMLDSQVSHRDSDATFFEDEQMTEQPSLPQWITALGLENTQMLYTTFVEIRPFVYICAIVMGVTLAVFPPLTEAIISSPKSVPRINNLTAWHFLLFNIGDYLGRLSTQWIKCSTAKILHWTNSGRILLIPILLMFPTLATPVSRLVIINSDLLFLFVVLLLGWSNGWIATMALILGPRFASNKELAGSVLGFALCIGLAFGAIASYPVLLVAGIS
ncbi:hypothetical protein GGI12_000543 [Dipsacomyces acuminosporus]|nr:hypothetical protein GGI12_000543 [Dipsacomyces acuminosporus]